MKIQKQTNRWSCLLTSTAMVLDIPQNQIVLELGHDGSEIVWSEHPEPYCRRSFHIQEMIDIAIKRHYLVTPIDAHPVSAVDPNLKIRRINQVIKRGIEAGNVETLILYEIQGLLNELLTDGYAIKTTANRFENYLLNNQGLLIGETRNGKPHACAWDGRRVFDPNGLIYSIESFVIESFYMFTYVG